jgi:hypothetical protein
VNAEPNLPDVDERRFCWLLLASAATGVAAPYVAAVMGEPPSVWWRQLLVAFGYFTNLSNLAVALFAAGRLFCPRSNWSVALGSMSGSTAIAVYISMTGITYHLLLTEHHSPQGVGRLGNVLTHTVTPILYVVYWFCFARGRAMSLVHTMHILYLPLLFLLYWLLRGPIVGSYPYFFIDVDRYGYLHVLLNSAGLCTAAWLLGVVYWAASRPSATPAAVIVEDDVNGSQRRE